MGDLGVVGNLTTGGRLAVRQDQNSDVTLEKATGEKEGYTIRRFGDDLFIYASKNGVTEDNYIATYNKASNSLDFNITDLTKGGVSVVGVYVGEIRLLPFRTTELPKGWYTCNGFSYDINSPIGQALNKLSETFKTDWHIKVTNGKINIPMMYYDPGTAGRPWQGYFLRPVVGSGKPIDRNPGSIEEDAIRNITGDFGSPVRWGDSWDPHGAFKLSYKGSANMASGDSDNWLQKIIFDLNNVNYPVADEIRPKNIGMTPAIYLGV